MTNEEKLRIIEKYGNDLTLIVEAVGLEKTMELATIFQGDRVSFPKRICNKLRDDAVRQDYDKMLIAQVQPIRLQIVKFLAGKYDLSTRTIERIINKTC